MKKSIILLLIIAILSLSGCEATIEKENVIGAYSEPDSEQQSAGMTDITVLFYADMDTNPVTTDVYSNHELLKLVYSPLIRTDETLKPYCELAQSYTREGKKYTVTLRDGLVFSDGSTVTATDVVKSFNVAKTTESSPYYESANAFSEYYAADDKTFICVTKSYDADAAALLDIPVMKNGVSGVGCGPYKFSQKNGNDVLVINDNYHKRASIPVIYLIDTKSDNLITSLFSAGELDIISVAGNDDLSLTSLRDYRIVTYPSNNFIYIGVNHQNEQLQKAEIRRAVSSVIDRKKTATQELVGLADGTVYPFNPCWYRLSVYNVNSNPDYSESEALDAAKLLKDTAFTLIIPEGSDIKTAVAQSIAESFKAVGLTLNISALPTDAYITAVQTGAYDLYIGETAISRDMDPTYLYGTGGSLNYSGYSNPELDNLFSEYKAQQTGIDTYLSEFSKQMPVIPVMFRKNVMYVASGIQHFSMQSVWNSFGDITSVKLK